MRNWLLASVSISALTLAAGPAHADVAIIRALAAGYYVSPNGNDSNAGTLAAPFLTPGACQTAMRAGNKACYLRAGKYTLPSGGLPLNTSDNNEVWQYYPPDGVATAFLDLSAANTIAINSTATPITFNGLRIGNTAQIMVFSQGNAASWINNTFDNTGITNSFYTLDIYGTNDLIAGNTFQNTTNSNPGGDARAIVLNANGLINSVVKNNIIQCYANYGIMALGATTGSLFYNNQIYGIGHYGGSPPTCGAQVDASGTGITIQGSPANPTNLFAANTISGVEGYDIVVSAGTAEFISDNTLQSNSDPVITLNGAGSSIIRRNNLTSAASIGLNLGDEHDACPRSNTANNLLIANNTISSVFEPIELTNTASSNIFGNIAGIGTVSLPAVTGTGTWTTSTTTLTATVVAGTLTSGSTTALRGTGVTANTVVSAGTGPTYTISQNQTLSSRAMNAGYLAPHYPAGLSMFNWQYADFCTYSQANNSNTVVANSFTSSGASAKYGVYIETLGTEGNAAYTAQNANTVSHNVLYPFGSSGTAALFDGGTNTAATDNKTSAGTSVALSPPVANAGPTQMVAGGQTVTLDGSATANFPGGGTAGVTYLWAQVSGTAVTLTNTTTPRATFTAPARPLSAAGQLVFSLTATNGNGSTTDKVMIGLDPNI